MESYRGSPRGVVKSSLLPFFGMVVQEWRRCRRIWLQAFLIPAIFRWFQCFSLWAVSRTQGDGFSQEYLRYLFPGMLVQTLFTEAFGNVMSSAFPSKLYGTMEAVLAAPTPHWAIVAGYAIGGFLRAFVVSAATLLGLWWCAGGEVFQIEGWAPLIGLGVAVALAGSLSGFMLALNAKSFDHTSLYSALVQGMFYFSGAFFVVNRDVLPSIVLSLLKFNPAFWVVRAAQRWTVGAKAASTGAASALVARWALCGLFAYSILVFWLAHRALRAGKANQFG